MRDFMEVLMQRMPSERIFFGTLLVLVILAMMYLYQSFWMDFGIAILICIATIGLKKRILRFIPSNFFSSFFSVLILTLLFVVPMLFLAQQAVVFFSHLKAEQLIFYFNASKEGIISLLSNFPVLEANFIDISKNFSPQDLINLSLKVSSFIGKQTLQFAIDVGFIVLFLFVLFYYARYFYIVFLKFMPFGIRQSQEIYDEVSSVLKIVLFASIINLILQGVAFGGLMGVLHYENALLLGVLYGMASLIPVVGGAVVWIPVAGYELYLGHYYSALGISLYSILFISIVIDSIVKPFIIGLLNRNMLDNPLRLNELVIFFAIFAGFSSFGFWGIVIGPAITAFFIAILRLGRKSYRQSKKSKKVN